MIKKVLNYERVWRDTDIKDVVAELFDSLSGSDKQLSVEELDRWMMKGWAVRKRQVTRFDKMRGGSRSVIDAIRRRKLYLKLLSSVRFKDTLLEELLPTSDLEKLADACNETSFACGEDVIKEGDAADAFYVIKSGEVRAPQCPHVLAEGD